MLQDINERTPPEKNRKTLFVSSVPEEWISSLLLITATNSQQMKEREKDMAVCYKSTPAGDITFVDR